jgi:hypothetical protein
MVRRIATYMRGLQNLLLANFSQSGRISNAREEMTGRGANHPLHFATLMPVEKNP